jgi:hypothetical protein
MTKNELVELLKYSSPLEIYVVSWKNNLIKVYCPFEVQVLQDIGTLKTGQFVFVDEIKVTIELKTVYIIGDKAYYYYHFHIVI